ncbi:kinesin-like protein KIF21A isoform X2 [Daphnia pulicaria]|uniref:kinesin-like protein KIF21A isoform X2 n=1 Tax=Daphnia pulicaria TaxID=35523 RepID=UPI001EEC782A|nr:kinesin-like protein KIF21A isoform X2 [Daphnia pulicaria]
MADDDSTSVRVAVRIRPQSAREVIDMCRTCTTVISGEPQVILGADKAFTYDYVFDMDSGQVHIYNTCVRHLIEGCLQGYNATVLAYGQTGSGKTYSMGTGLEADQQLCSMSDNVGILPRSVHHLFNGIEMLREEAIQIGQTPPEFRVQAQFLELYNEEIIDLLEPTTRGQRSDMRIHEDQLGGIYVAGATSKSVASTDEAMHCLHMGALARTTASTQMNAQSSRSHAIFTLHIRQQRLAPAQNGNGDSDEGQPNGTGGSNGGDAGSELETLSAKLHFVDLAGSERLKRTGATGDRAKEGISINCGLLALGNVISALGDAARKALHVPYRDSKLTRLLQDSLGGNSRTLMIACCSPSDRDFMETLNTLKYANRARNIKNRVVLNQDRSSRTIALLRQEILQLQQELAEYKQGKRVVSEDGHEAVNDMFHENRLLQAENQTMRTRLKALQETVNSMTVRNVELQAQKAASTWSKAGSDSDITQMVQHYLMEIEELKARLCESESMASQLRLRAATLQTNKSPHKGGLSPRKLNSSVNVLIEEAKRNLEKDKTLLQKNQLRREISGGNDSAMEASVSSMEPSSNAGQSRAMSSGEASDEEEDNTPSSAEGESDGGDGDSGSSSSDDEANQADENGGMYSAELAELTSEISVKQQLIEELELSQRRLDIMKHHYEEKLVQLQERIRATTEERDKVLAGFAQNHGPSNPNVEGTLRRVREDYERKLSDLQSRLKKFQAAQQEHAKLLKSQSDSERQLKSLKNDLLDMKRNKVKLMQKMKEDANRHKEIELKRTREIAQLRKESRKRENEIRTLQMDKRVKETVLKRKQEEVNALRKVQARQGVLSDRASGRVVQSGRNSRKPRQPMYSPKVAKQKWHKLEHNLSQMALNRLTVSQLEKDLERLMGVRDELGRSLSETLRIRDRAFMRGKEESYIRELDDQLESLKANIEYVQENIAECQRNIVQIEETKEGQGDLDMELAIQPNDMEEARYLFAKLINMSLNHATLAAQREASNKELQNQVKQVLERDAVHQQLLQHMLAHSDLEVYNLLATGTTNSSSALEEPGGGGGGISSRSRSRSPSPAESVASGATTATNATGSGRYSVVSVSGGGGGGGPPTLPPPIVEPLVDLPPIPNIARSQKIDIRGSRGPSSDNIHRVDHLAITPPQNMTTSTSSLASPRLPRKSANHSNSNLLAKLSSSEPGDTSPTPPASPPTFRRGGTSREENPNVFSRLTHGTNVGQEPVPDRGVVHPFQGKLSNKSPLICTRTAEGHCQAVLSICATDANLFSASKDRTVKVWDLHSGVEIQSLDRHPNNVVAVKYSPETGLVFTASSAYVKVWDLRQSPSRCIKTLSSSGWPASGNQANTTSTRSLQLPQGEASINDIALSGQSSAVLYAAAGSQVRIWDIRKFSSTGKLSGGHQAAVMCLAVGNAPMAGIESDANDKVEFVITGSKDHYVKVFEVRDGATGVLSPRFNLDPPHYDGVQCLSLSGTSLVSGSRDACIKLWDIEQGEQVLSLSNVHRDWICGLVHLPQRLVISGCRGGVLRLWSTESWEPVGEMRAHSASVNAIAFNSTNIFTASNDNTVNIWRLRSNVDSISPEAGESF